MGFSRQLLLVCLGLLCLNIPVQSCSRSLNPFSSSSKKDITSYYDPTVDESSAVVSTQQEDERVWRFAVDGRRTPYNFIDQKGQLTGFDVDLVAQVCKIANKKCETVLSEFTECTFSSRNINLAGRGLMSGWFDGCPTYEISVDRRGAFDFTTPYLATDSTFTVAPGNPSGFDPTLQDYSKFTIVHLTGAVTNTHCLARLGKSFGNVTVADNLPDAKSKLLNREADVLFSPRHHISGLDVLPERFRCDDGGVAMMTKKGSDVSSWWNPAFSSLVRSRQFASFCASSNLKYNDNFRCLTKREPRAPSQLPDKTWLFAVSGRRKPFNYLDENGVLVGHDVDFVKAVCRVASQKCDMVLTEFTECGFSERNINYAGRGILDDWFDACTGYADSMDRRNNYDFTHAYLKSSSTFTVALGNPSGFDPLSSDYSNFTFTHLTGAYTNAACLNRLQKKFKKIVIAQNLPDAKRILASGEADVLFSPRKVIPGLKTFPQLYHCEENGTCMLALKGSSLITWWNQAFETFVKTGAYQRQCRENSMKYNYTINCFTSAEMAPQFYPYISQIVLG